MNTNGWRGMLSFVGICVALGACAPEVPAADSAVIADDHADERRRVRSNFQVQIDGVWRGICCIDGLPTVTSAACTWSEYDRTLTDETAGQELDCPEGDPNGCWCNDDGERLHGYNGWDVGASLYDPDGGPVYPNELTETCLFVNDDRVLASEWSHEYCTYFKLD